jgi:hypothetical protein
MGALILLKCERPPGPEASMRYLRSPRSFTVPRHGPGCITVIGVGPPPPLTLRPLAMEILRIWEVKQAPERQAKGDRGGRSSRRSGPARPRAR